MAFGNGYTIGFAFVVCVVCSTALATVSMGLKDRQDDNRRRDLCKNILSALDLPEAVDGVRPALSGEEIDSLWEEKIELKAVDPKTGEYLGLEVSDLDGNGLFDHEDLKIANDRVKNTSAVPEILGVFLRKDNGAIALPMTGKGLWGPLSAYVAFDTKLETITGTTFFAPKETPGLGAEIMNSKFMSQWPGKSISQDGKIVPVRVLKPAVCDEATDTHCVDGVSGATITSRGVDKMISKSLDQYQTYIQKVRK